MSQSRIDRYKQAGVLFAEDYGYPSDNFTYNTPNPVPSPYGPACQFDGTTYGTIGSPVQTRVDGKITFICRCRIDNPLEHIPFFVVASEATHPTGTPRSMFAFSNKMYDLATDGYLVLFHDSTTYGATSEHFFEGTENLFITGEWNDIVLTHNGTVLSFYLNGVLITSKVDENIYDSSFINAYLGVYASDHDIGDITFHTMNGVTVAEYICDDRAWTHEEIRNYTSNTEFDHISLKCFPNYNIDGTLLEHIGPDEVTNIAQNRKSDGLTSLGLTELQRKDFIHQYGGIVANTDKPENYRDFITTWDIRDVGPERIKNGTFDGSLDHWIGVGGTFENYDGTALLIINDDAGLPFIYQEILITDHQIYNVSFKTNMGNASELRVAVYDEDTSTIIHEELITTTGTHSFIFKAIGAITSIGLQINESTATGHYAFFDDVSMKTAIGLDFPVIDGYSYDCNVNWGDGITEHINGWDDPKWVHQYATTGYKNVHINGLFEKVRPYTREELVSIDNIGYTGFTSFADLLNNISGLNSVNSGYCDTSLVTDMTRAFRNLRATTVNLDSIDSSNVTIMENTFQGSGPLPPDVRDWDTSSVVNMEGIFANSNTLTSPPDVTNWTVSNVDSLSHAFTDMSALLIPPPVRDWDTSKVTRMFVLFGDMESIVTPPDVSKWDTSSCDFMQGVFTGLLSVLTPPDISNWDMSKVTTIRNFFASMESIITPPDVSKWDTSSIIQMSFAFYNTVSLLTPPDVSNWDTQNLRFCVSTFGGMKSITTAPDVSSWDVSKVENMTSMFSKCIGITELNVQSWDITSVTSMNNFLFGVKLDTGGAHGYDAMLKRFADAHRAGFANDNVVFGGGECKYSVTGLIDRDYLRTVAHWSITDDGQV